MRESFEISNIPNRSKQPAHTLLKNILIITVLLLINVSHISNFQTNLMLLLCKAMIIELKLLNFDSRINVLINYWLLFKLMLMTKPRKLNYV